MKILIVDDNDDLRYLLKIMLAEYITLEARNGSEAVGMFKVEKPNLVLMDILMPVMDGIDATKEIIKIDPQAIVLAITAYTSKTDKIMEAGAKEVIQKPMRKKTLLKKAKIYLVNST